MAEHRVPKGNIIYIIPTDELFIKYKNNEAFIDEYGRLMNRKPHRVLKELKHYVADSEMQESYASSIKDLVRDKMVEYSKYAIDRVGDVFFYEVIPNVWRCMFLSRNLWTTLICIKCLMNGEKEKIDFQMHRIILFTKAVRGLFWT